MEEPEFESVTYQDEVMAHHQKEPCCGHPTLCQPMIVSEEGDYFLTTSSPNTDLQAFKDAEVHVVSTNCSSRRSPCFVAEELFSTVLPRGNWVKEGRSRYLKAMKKLLRVSLWISLGAMPFTAL